MPEYPGGTNNFLMLLLRKFNYPKQEVFQGSFSLEFIIDETVNIIGERIYNKSRENYTAAERELLKVLRNMPKWKPGKCNGKPVPVRTF